MALIVGAVTLVTRTLQTEPIVRQWQVVVGETMNVHSQTAAQIFDAQGKAGLETFLKRLESSERVSTVGFFRQNGEQIAGGKFNSDVANILPMTFNSDETEFERFETFYLIGRKTALADGSVVALITHRERPRMASHYAVTTTQIWQTLAVILTAGLVCYALAFYLSAPISKLRRATQDFAEGNLETRLNIRRRDELGGLAREFDQMAERIETLVTSEKRLTQDISHELRSPLARMNVALELARAKSNDQTKPLIERIEIESKRLNEMISQLLVLSKLETGSETFDRREINLTRTFEQIVADANFEAQGLGKAVQVKKQDSVKVFGNENLLRSAIENVLRNAVRYTKADTTVEVKLARENKNAVVSVRDYGAGVPETELKKLFRPFYRVSQARERKTGGIGLGLAIAERAVHAHQGTIEARNTENGLAVEIRLPCLS